MERCTLCPRNCAARRGAGETGVCGQTWELKVARAALHYWEEPCISGKSGSGAVFFSGCALHCVFCQNAQIASGAAGTVIPAERLAEIFLELQEKGACNINLVTAGHFAPQVAAALIRAKDQGLSLPVVYNTGGYEKTDTLRRLEGLIDIYLPDFKYLDPALGRTYSHAEDYSAVAKAAVAEMVRQTGPPVFRGGDETDLMERGTIVRILVLPGCTKDAKNVIRYLHGTYGNTVCLSILNQFTPMPGLSEYPAINRRVTRREYAAVVDYAVAIGVERGFIQEGETAGESFIPQFDGEGVR